MSISDDSDFRKLLQASLVAKDSHDAAVQLWRALPAVYRDSDNGDKESRGDLDRFLEGFARVLNQLRKTLEQRLDDVSPLTCQTWLLPYSADLLDVRLVSPDLDGQRQEIAKAIAWRKRKGTVGAAVEIAEAVGQMPIIAFEGYRSVATTPRVGLREPTMRELGELDWPKIPNTPAHWSARPGTPAVTVDFRELSRPKRVNDDDPTPLSIKSRFGEQEIRWQHEAAPHGIPPYLNGYQDISMRTVDVRDSNYKQGHHHPKRLRLYTPIPEGFIAAEPEWSIGPQALEHLMTPMQQPGEKEPSEEKENILYYLRVDPTEVPLEDTPSQSGFRYLRIEERRIKQDASSRDNLSKDLMIRSTLLTLKVEKDKPLPSLVLPEAWSKIWGDDENSGDSDYFVNWHEYFDDKHNLFLVQWERWFDADTKRWRTRLRGGTWNMAEGCPGEEFLKNREHIRREPRWPTIYNDFEIDPPETNFDHQVQIEQLVVPNWLWIKAKYCIVYKAAVKTLTIDAFETVNQYNVRLVDSLIGHLEAPNHIVEAEYCTIILTGGSQCLELRASDSILLGNNTTVAATISLRYCAVASLTKPLSSIWLIHEPSVHTRTPQLYGQYIDTTGRHALDLSQFGTRGFGVIQQASHASIRHGAEDGGELGAFHHRHYCGRQDAIVEKLKEYLPAGMTPVLIVDPIRPTP
ncbi:MAG: hypothetical protein JXA30_19550 [Deltaproteobacteria bacterium]|nr:hypothetical protein [Deltaproteobacteria bacterium]